MSEQTEFTYWCPSEGEHVFDPVELHVGVVRPVFGKDGEHIASDPIIVLAVLPPLPAWGQPEPIARLIVEALQRFDWHHVDGLVAWMAAHGAPVRVTDALLDAL